MKDWWGGASAMAESIIPTMTVRYLEAQQMGRSHTVNGLRLELGQESLNPARIKTHVRQTHKPSSATPPNSETRMPAKTDTEKSVVQTEINASQIQALLTPL